MMRPRVTAPYYLHGRGKQRWHSNQAENAAIAGGVAGAAGAALHHPKYRGAAIEFARSKGYHVPHEHAELAGKTALVAAGAAGAYGTYHAVQAARENKRLNAKRKAK